MSNIPNTVYNGAKALAQSGITYTTVHTLGDNQMIKAAKEDLIAGTFVDKGIPKLLAVTELISTSDDTLHEKQNCNLPMKQQVLSLTRAAKGADTDGVICSPLEVKNLRQNVGDDFLCITPNIRLAGNAKDDQSGVATPAQAKE